MDNETNRLIPELRFPEFVKDEEWEEKKLDEVATILKGKGISKSDVVKNGNLPCIRYGELYTHYHETIDEIKSYTNLEADDLVFSQANDVIIPASGETQIDIATASCVLKNGIALGGDLNIIRTKVNGVFLSYYLNNAKRKDIAQLAQGISVVHLYPNQLKTLVLNIPNPVEQQKIASCLSSLDELITAHSQKLAALKDHKKGLMQNLFPQEGETVPKWRFPEFEEDGDWEEKKLGSICEVITKGTTPQEFSKTGIRFIKIEAFKDNHIIPEKCMFVNEDTHNKELKRSILKENDILFAIAGATIGKVNIVKKDILPANTNQALSILRLKEKENQNFILHILKSEIMQGYIQKSISVGAQPNLNLEQMGSFSFAYPENLKEQQKIAEFLSALDDLITAQAEKIEQLKLHKKGLMQGLFPKTND